jgi:hypothetical protein
MFYNTANTLGIWIKRGGIKDQLLLKKRQISIGSAAQITLFSQSVYCQLTLTGRNRYVFLLSSNLDLIKEDKY